MENQRKYLFKNVSKGIVNDKSIETNPWSKLNEYTIAKKQK